MAVSKDTERITISVNKEVKDYLQKYSDLYGIPVSALSRNMMYVGLDQFHILHKLGIGHLVKGLEVFTKNFKNLMKSKEETNGDVIE